jgi:hypothetical protein
MQNRRDRLQRTPNEQPFFFSSMLRLSGFRCALEPEVCLPNEHRLVVAPVDITY